MNDNFSQQAISGRILGTERGDSPRQQGIPVPESMRIQPQSQLDTVLGAQRELLDKLSHAVIRTGAVFAKAMNPRCSADACGKADEAPEQAPIVESITANNLLLASILRDLQSINERSIL